MIDRFEFLVFLFIAFVLGVGVGYTLALDDFISAVESVT